MKQEEQNFILLTPDSGIITSGSKYHVDLEAIKTEFGHNFNTLMCWNNSDEEISLTVDGRKMFFIKSGSAVSIDWRDKILFDDIQIINENGLTDTNANEIRLSVGRTGEKNGSNN